MTRKQLRDRVINEIGLQEIEDYNEGTLVDDLLHEAAIDLLARTRCTVRCIHLKTQADVDTYVLSKSILALVDLEDGHVPRYRRDETPDYHDPALALVVYPTNYVAPSTRSFHLIRSDLLRIQPAPAQDGEIDVWAVIRPSRMLADDDTPSEDAFGGIPDEYHDALYLYACWKGASYADDESASQGERYRFQYEGQDGNGGKLALIKKLVNKRGTARAPRRRVRLRYVRPHSRYVG